MKRQDKIAVLIDAENVSKKYIKQYLRKWLTFNLICV